VALPVSEILNIITNFGAFFNLAETICAILSDHPADNSERSARIAKLLAGKYTPQGLFDITYEGAGLNFASVIIP
jgi:hypothetical protein